MVEHRPANGGGSCARCLASLNLASQQVDGRWYCSSACAMGRAGAAPRAPAVPEPRLYARPQRFFGARRPKELRSA